ncbi:hypothetical protein Sp245p_26390 (plasmid) [Azospirillum baldaniorum]|uniref:Uncharacterized protein n=1 Tax=Azospirillum baldaniorum TaxID=1064539 RepID=A0A9P1JZT9_9PROT|nr:hypothetical protein [Azospirillum baldaniorum]AWJ93255.1 hypothetical protein Sp245p_25875 [Azospirillum baldaniorum]AWJ93353.1 hypothetical protein Sp245p_26390 [Azospirillum baldaniorum]TWA77949.1 hypothetical protein FBZ85_106109 [Azospirillum brasilense]CCD02951.1 protein of unknown function [Azospirillum baldaniorum]
MTQSSHYTVTRSGSHALVIRHTPKRKDRCVAAVPLCNDPADAEGRAYSIAEDFVTGRINERSQD